MTKRTTISATIGILVAAGAGYLAYRYFRAVEAELSPEVANRLPISKDLQTISDVAGNYDMDGVSFDTEGVIVSSDAHKDIIAPI